MLIACPMLKYLSIQERNLSDASSARCCFYLFSIRLFFSCCFVYCAIWQMYCTQQRVSLHVFKAISRSLTLLSALVFLFLTFIPLFLHSLIPMCVFDSCNATEYSAHMKWGKDAITLMAANMASRYRMHACVKNVVC